MSADEITVVGLVIDSPKGRRLEVSDEAKLELTKAIRYFRKAGPCTIRVREGKESKSLPQLRKVHKLFALIAEESGNDKDAVKKWLKGKYLERPEEYVDLETGEVKARMIVPSLASLEKDEMSEFISRVVLWAAEFLHMDLEQAVA